MSLKFLNKNELDQGLKVLVRKERELLHEILRTLQEIERRKIYLELGYASLFLYLTEEIKYPKGSAQRRIDAMRLLVEIPELGAKIESGEINLGQMTLVQKAIRDVAKVSEKIVTVQEKAELFQQIANKDHFQSEQEVAAFFDLPVIQKTKVKPQGDESVRVELTLSKELYEKIKKAQALLSHALRDAELTSYLEYVTERVIKQKTSVRVQAEESDSSQVPVNGTSENHVDSGQVQDIAGVTPFKSPFESADRSCESVQVPFGTRDLQSKSTPSQSKNAFTQRTKKIILRQHEHCTHIDPVTHKECRSQWFLQVDHRQSVWAEGDGSIENAQVLCAVHNRQKYQKEAGIRNI